LALLLCVVLMAGGRNVLYYLTDYLPSGVFPVFVFY
jgi:hypothetical protein